MLTELEDLSEQSRAEDRRDRRALSGVDLILRNYFFDCIGYSLLVVVCYINSSWLFLRMNELKSDNPAPNDKSDESSTIFYSESGKKFEIREVWAHNLDAEMKNIREVVETYPYVAMVCSVCGYCLVSKK